MSLIDNIYFFLTGIGLGLIVSIPVGPVNILCIQHSLALGFWAGFAIGCGAMFADLVIAAMAILGFTALSGFMQSHERILHLMGGIILMGFGLRLFLSHPTMLPENDASLSPFRHFGAMPQSFLLTVTNPGALLGIFALVGSTGSVVGGLTSFHTAFYLLLGLFVGGALWWAALARGISLFRRRMSAMRLLLINRTAGVLLLFSGLGLILNAVFF